MTDSILRAIQSSVPRCTYHVDVGVGSLHDSIEQFRVDLDPVYQRDRVWTLAQEQSFVGAMLENPKSIPPFWFNWTSKEFNRSESELVDGKQRINALLRWLDGKFTALCPCGESVHYNELTEIDLRNLSISTTMDWNFVELNQRDVMKFYIRLNSGGTVHTKKELEKVRSMIDKLGVSQTEGWIKVIEGKEED